MREGRGGGVFKWLIPLACVIVVIMIMFFYFFNDMKEDAVSRVESDMEEVAERYALKINNDLQCVNVAGDMAEQVIGQQKTMNADAIRQLLASLVDKTQIYEAIYCNENKVALNSTGEYVNLRGAAYENLTGKNTKTTYIYQSSDSVTKTANIVIVIPVGKDKGNLLLYYPLSRISDLVVMEEEFEVSPFTAMVSGDGTILQPGGVESNFLKKSSIWENVDKAYQSEAVRARVRMSNMNVGCVALASEGEERTLVFTPIGINDWCLVIGVDQDYVDASQHRIWTKVAKMLYQLLGVMILFLIIFAVINYIGKLKKNEESKGLQEKADTDLLTGLNNKLATERKIKEYMRDYPNSLGMMFVLDIDNFKKINDTMGHAFGDEVLRSLGKQIGVIFRVTDIIGRTGGDEFTIFLKALKNDENTLREAEKLAYFFKHFQVGEYVKYSATASIGAAVFPADGSDFETLYKSADQALYKAKKRGKNQLAFYDDRDRK